MAMDFVAGCLGGCAGVITGHPLDTLKVHIQTTGGSSLSCMRNITSSSQGSLLSSLYRGVGPPLVSVAGINAMVFGTFGLLRRAMPEPDTWQSHCVAGATAGMMQCFITSPVELIKTRQQLCKIGDKIPSGTLTAVKYVYKTGGLRALYRGLGITMLRDSPAFAVYFASYDILTKNDKSASRIFMAGGLAGALSWVFSYPIDVIKSRYQSETGWKSAWQCAHRSIEREGMRCLFRGMAPVMLRAILCNGSIFATVAWTEKAYEMWSADSALSSFVYGAALSEAICHSDIVELHSDYIVVRNGLM